MVWEMLSWHAFDPLIRVYEHLNKISYLNILVGQIYPAMFIVYPKGDGCIQQYNVSYQRGGNVQDSFEQHVGEFTFCTEWTS